MSYDTNNLEWVNFIPTVSQILNKGVRIIRFNGFQDQPLFSSIEASFNVLKKTSFKYFTCYVSRNKTPIDKREYETVWCSVV